MRAPLSRIAFARSGDKGDGANVGVIAIAPCAYEHLLAQLAPERVRAHFAGVCRGAVERFELPNLRAVNFLLHESLGGGGTVSLMLDAQGKTFAAHLLALEVEVPESVIDECDRVVAGEIPGRPPEEERRA